jgi:hypothetical protein
MTDDDVYTEMDDRGKVTTTYGSSKTWRIGAYDGRTLYIEGESGNPGDDQLVGMMDSRDLAQFVVDAVNHFYAIDPDHPCPAVMAVNDFYGRDVVPQDHGPVLAAPAEADLPVVPLDSLSDYPRATDQ